MFKATQENSVKNDFVFTCKKYLEKLEINLSFEEIQKMSNFSFKKLLKEKVNIAAFEYLKLQQSKQEKIQNINYSKLVMQEYLADGNRNLEVSKVIFKARGMVLDIKTQKGWKYDDKLCSGCSMKDETGEEILSCSYFGENLEYIQYSWFFSEKLEDKVSAAKIMIEKLKVRKKIREEVTLKTRKGTF